MEDFGKTEVADFEDIGSVEAACKTEVNPRKRNAPTPHSQIFHADIRTSLFGFASNVNLGKEKEKEGK